MLKMKSLLMYGMRLMQVAFAMFVGLSFIACSSDDSEEPLDGDWPPMEWKQDQGSLIKNGSLYIVNAKGDTYKFTCSNYSPWFCDVYVPYTDIHYFGVNDAESFDDLFHVSYDWFKADLSKHEFTITFEENTTGRERLIGIGTTAGDIFHNFAFLQSAI